MFPIVLLCERGAAAAAAAAAEAFGLNMGCMPAYITELWNGPLLICFSWIISTLFKSTENILEQGENRRGWRLRRRAGSETAARFVYNNLVWSHKHHARLLNSHFSSYTKKLTAHLLVAVKSLLLFYVKDLKTLSFVCWFTFLKITREYRRRSGETSHLSDLFHLVCPDTIQICAGRYYRPAADQLLMITLWCSCCSVSIFIYSLYHSLSMWCKYWRALCCQTTSL